jgi:MOSC domain-containing protein YiiM
MTDAHIRSVQVGRIAEQTDHHGRAFETAFGKQVVAEPVRVGRLGLDGDQQANRKFHGGEHRAVLAFCAAHYARWEAETGIALPDGGMGENLTIVGLDEDTVCIGDIYAVGDDVLLQVSQPRQPCAKIGRYWHDPSLTRKVSQTGRTGWYMRVLQEGAVARDMRVKLMERLHPEWTIARAHSAMNNRAKDPQTARELAELAALEPGWRTTLAAAGHAG